MDVEPTPRPATTANPRGSEPLNEAAIIALALRDRAAFAPLYQAYLDPIYRYCYRRLGCREAAEDAASLIFERALRSLPSFRNGSFRAWLFAIAHNVVADSYRRRGQPQSSVDELEIADPAPPPEYVALLADERRLLAAALALLPPDQRQVIELRLSGVPSAEVAAILGRSPQAVRALQLRATKRLKMLLAAPATNAEASHA